MSRAKSINESVDLSAIAQEIISKLKYAGFNILRYDAYSTNSIYLKLDYGVCNTIRVSDHTGKKYLKYRYNLIAGLDKSYSEIDKCPRYYYSLSDIDLMIKHIISDRDTKIHKYGVARYIKYMNDNKKNHKGDKGFWSQSYLV